MARVLSLTARAGHWADWRKGGARGVRQATVQGDEQFPGACMVPVFTEPDALPCAQVQFTLRDWNSERGAQETCLHMSRL